MLDSFGRKIDYLRISVTDRCNLRCLYCMPAEGVPLKPHSHILSYEQIRDVAAAATALGVRKIRLTGGEPLVRRDIAALVRMLASLKGIDDLAMTTNGILLEEMAETLKRAGLKRINVSLDTLDPARYRELTRGGDIHRVLNGLNAAARAGLAPIKINMLVFDQTTRSEIGLMEDFCAKRGFVLQLIRRFSLAEGLRPCGEIQTHRPPQCNRCNRLRLTADGRLRPCLFSNIEIHVNFSDIRASLLAAVAAKPERGTSCNTREMWQIGG